MQQAVHMTYHLPQQLVLLQKIECIFACVAHNRLDPELLSERADMAVQSVHQ